MRVSATMRRLMRWAGRSRKMGRSRRSLQQRGLSIAGGDSNAHGRPWNRVTLRAIDGRGGRALPTDSRKPPVVNVGFRHELNAAARCPRHRLGARIVQLSGIARASRSARAHSTHLCRPSMFSGLRLLLSSLFHAAEMTEFSDAKAPAAIADERVEISEVAGGVLQRRCPAGSGGLQWPMTLAEATPVMDRYALPAARLGQRGECSAASWSHRQP